MADYNQPTFVEKRVRYFQTQDLKDQDRIDDQKYHLDRLRRYSRALSVAGIVDGLTVKPGINQVTVAPGTAIDRRGRQLVLGYEESVKDLSAYTGKPVEVELVIAYRERPSDLEDGQGTRFWERPWVGPLDKLLTDPAQALDPADALHLARISVANDGAVTVHTSKREASGLRLAGGVLDDETTWHMLRVRDGALHLTGNRPGVAKLLVDGELQVKGLSTLAGDVSLPGTAKLTVGGALSVTGATTLTGGVTLPGTAKLTVGGALSVTGATTLTGGVTLPGTAKLTVGGALSVTGASTLTGDVTLPGTAKLTVGGALSVTGASTLTGDVTLPGAAKLTVGGALAFGAAPRQMINLGGADCGIGIQDQTQYARTAGNFAWYKGGSHDNGARQPGTGGAEQMVLDADGTLRVRGRIESGQCRIQVLFDREPGPLPKTIDFTVASKSFVIVVSGTAHASGVQCMTLIMTVTNKQVFPPHPISQFVEQWTNSLGHHALPTRVIPFDTGAGTYTLSLDVQLNSCVTNADDRFYVTVWEV